MSEIETDSNPNLTHKERNAIALIRKRVVERLHEGFAGFAKDKDPDFDADVPF